MSKVSLEIAPLEEAVGRMDRKMPIARALTSAEWADVPLALRERAFWTANFAKADVLQVMHDAIGDRLKLEPRESVPGRGAVTMSRDNFITELRDRLEASGYVPPQGKRGTIQDLTSTGRLGLIFDMNTQAAQGYARWKSGQAEGAVFAFPAQELFRSESRQVPRNWIARWQAAGGQISDGGRLIAAKDDPIWVAISAFGTPFPPFDYQSGMDVRDISRREAEALGVIAPAQRITPPAVGFNDSLQKSVVRMDPSILTDTMGKFGRLVEAKDGIVRWVAGRHSVAISIDVPSSLPNAQLIREAVADVARVHDYTDSAQGVGIPLTPVGGKTAKASSNAEYYRNHPATNMPAINVSPRGDALSVVHEIGHEVDHRLFGHGMTFGSHFNPELAPLMRAIEASEEIQALKGMRWSGRSAAVQKARGHRNYLLEDHEQFARAYSQWIAERSGRMEYSQGIESRMALGWGSQWKPETFAPIAAEFEKLFKGKGWMP
jgi:hypothetical protein